MGVNGLLPLLKEIQEPSLLEKYRGQTLAIDTYGWLHRGLISCAQELTQDLPTKKYITSIMRKLDMLKYFGVEPYLVFDGAALPTKAETANERRLKREEARKKADMYAKTGNKKMAWKEFMKAAAVTHEMAKSIMVELDKMNIKYVVAPYEADPQMVYLEKVGLVDGILSEDSDLLIFGCKRLITKLKDDSSCVEICRENFCKIKKDPFLRNFNQDQLRLVAMLSGCDYTKGFSSIGLKTAFPLVANHGSLEKVLSALRAEGKIADEKLTEEIQRADLAFQYQKVFNPVKQELTTLNEYPPDMNIDFELLEACCGKTIEKHIQVKVSNGKLHPLTHRLLVSREQYLSVKSNSFSGFGERVNSIDGYFSVAKAEKRTVKKHEETEPEKPLKRVKSMSMEYLTQTSHFFKKASIKDVKTDLETKVEPKKEPSLEKAATTLQSPKPNDTPSIEKASLEPVSSPTKAFDSNFSGSEVPDEFSSPIAKNPVTENTDQQAFDVCEEDDEVEESPQKSKLTTFAQELRQKFVFNEKGSSEREHLERKPETKPLERKPLERKSEIKPLERKSLERKPLERKPLTKVDINVSKTTKQTRETLLRFAFRHSLNN